MYVASYPVSTASFFCILEKKTLFFQHANKKLAVETGYEASMYVRVVITISQSPHSVDPPTITDQPTALTSVTRGDNVTFSVVADGERLSYSWLFQGAELLSNDTVIGVNTSELMIFDVHDAVMGNYQCVVSNAAGSVSSDIVQLALGKYTAKQSTCT